MVIKRSQKTLILAISWMSLIVMELLSKRSNHSNRVLGIASSLFRIIKRLTIFGLLIANVFMAISALDNDEKENNGDRK